MSNEWDGYIHVTRNTASRRNSKNLDRALKHASHWDSGEGEFVFCSYLHVAFPERSKGQWAISTVGFSNPYHANKKLPMHGLRNHHGHLVVLASALREWLIQCNYPEWQAGFERALVLTRARLAVRKTALAAPRSTPPKPACRVRQPKGKLRTPAINNIFDIGITA